MNTLKKKHKLSSNYFFFLRRPIAGIKNFFFSFKLVCVKLSFQIRKTPLFAEQIPTVVSDQVVALERHLQTQHLIYITNGHITLKSLFQSVSKNIFPLSSCVRNKLS